ncbi:GNAT family N-acetyltransferase [Streptomyces hokutonensis]|uniref:GNAT family N-acetyltransferase n=1 Tax=Streptomyces hokutonensis TaxID=1306990 RepID=UPI0036A69B46
MTAPVVLRIAATPTAPALVLRPWRLADVPALVDAGRDPLLRQWITSIVDNEVDGARWVREQERGWAAGERFAFAVLGAQAGSGQEQLVGNMVLKEVTPGKPAAEVGYWTAAHARGMGVAPRALNAVSDWAFDALAADGLERLELLHQVDNLASCRVAEKGGYEFDSVRPAVPPGFPRDGHLHIRRMNV